MSEATAYLYNLMREWEEKSAKGSSDYYPYTGTLNEILYHADLRFNNYQQFQDIDGEFPVRLKNWLNNLSDERQKKALFKLVPWIFFIDRIQALSLCRDAYRRIIIPWLTTTFTSEDLLSSDYESRIISLLRAYSLFSITESFYFSDFLNVNNLAGLPKPLVFGESRLNVEALILSTNSNTNGFIIFEDMVGTGSQASTIIKEVKRHIPSDRRVLFIPLIILESGLENLSVLGKELDITIDPVLVIPEADCIKETPSRLEPPEFTYIRTLIQQTSARVLQPYNEHDDPPSSPFGYKGCGALVVPYRNTPNNTLPLIHHRAPDWTPLFRRLHHKGL